MITLKRILLENEEPTKTLDDVRPLVPQLIAAAQQEYDVWDQSGEDGDPELGFGGICQNIAEAMSGILSEHGIDSTTVDNGGMGDQHVWTVFRVVEGIYEIDIPPHIYERGSGYVWKKIPGVTFSTDHLHISKFPAGISWEEILISYQ